jgi:hypothetical protein
MNKKNPDFFFNLHTWLCPRLDSFANHDIWNPNRIPASAFQYNLSCFLSGFLVIRIADISRAAGALDEASEQ